MQRAHQLLNLASKLGIKYASIDASTIKNEVQNDIRTAIGNASTVPSSGIMPFQRMLDQDQASLAINVTRHGNNILVSEPSIVPITVAEKYSALPNQIKRYLEKYWEIFPSTHNG